MPANRRFEVLRITNLLSILCVWTEILIGVSRKVRNEKKAYRFPISHFCWWILSGTMAVKGLRRTVRPHVVGTVFHNDTAEPQRVLELLASKPETPRVTWDDVTSLRMKLTECRQPYGYTDIRSVWDQVTCNLLCNLDFRERWSDWIYGHR